MTPLSHLHHESRRPNLSTREIEVLQTWLHCPSKNAVGKLLYIEATTVDTHITRIRNRYRDVGRPASTKVALLINALCDGYVTLDQLIEMQRGTLNRRKDNPRTGDDSTGDDPTGDDRTGDPARNRRKNDDDGDDDDPMAIPALV